MTLPSPTTYGTIKWKFVVGIADSTDGDTSPDLAYATGTVTFTPSPSINGSVGLLLSPTSSVKTTIGLVPVVATLNPATGVLGVGGVDNVVLVATDNASDNPINWVYTVSFQISIAGTAIPIKGFPITVPGGTTQDLTDAFALVVDPSSGAVITKGDPGVGFVIYAGSWPARPSISTPVFWLGSSTVPAGMLDGDMLIY